MSLSPGFRLVSGLIACAALHHFSLCAGPGVLISLLGVSSDGTFTRLGTADAATSALLRFTDSFPASP